VRNGAFFGEYDLCRVRIADHCDAREICGPRCGPYKSYLSRLIRSAASHCSEDVSDDGWPEYENDDSIYHEEHQYDDDFKNTT